MFHKNSGSLFLPNTLAGRLSQYRQLLLFQIRNIIVSKRLGILALLLVIGMVPMSLNGQSRQSLETKRKQLLEEIKATNSRLDKTKKSKATTFDQYVTLRSQVQNRQMLIENFTLEIAQTDSTIINVSNVIESLKEDQERLKEDYAAMLRVAYRMKLNDNGLQFIFSANSFNDAYKRWQYLRQYERYRKNQAYLIEQTQIILEMKVAQLEEERTEKISLLEQAREQKEVVGREMNEMNSLLSKLKGDEKKLLAALRDQQKAHDNLNNAIERIIQQEMERKRRAARTTAGIATAPASSGEDKLSNVFSQNKGKLPWPVKKGSITGYFGRQEHPTIKGIKITNNGIDIRTGKGAEVYAIFEGKVAGTQFIPGYKHTVIIQHGNYYSVYSNLEQIFVKRNDIIKNGQRVGVVGTKQPDLHFEIWQEKTRQNPVNWIRE